MPVAVFTANDANDNEYMGLLIQEGFTEVKVYLGHADNAVKNVPELVKSLEEAMRVLRENQKKARKLLVAEGDLKNGIRTAERRVLNGQGG